MERKKKRIPPPPCFLPSYGLGRCTRAEIFTRPSLFDTHELGAVGTERVHEPHAEDEKGEEIHHEGLGFSSRI